MKQRKSEQLSPFDGNLIPGPECFQLTPHFLLSVDPAFLTFFALVHHGTLFIAHWIVPYEEDHCSVIWW
jgi:hypothetical protein